jgi:hypothetical protein
VGWDWLVTFWEQWFDKNSLHWLIFVYSTTSHVSIKEQHVRQGCIQFATNELIRQYISHPEWQRQVLLATLFPIGHHFFGIFTRSNNTGPALSSLKGTGDVDLLGHQNADWLFQNK